MVFRITQSRDGRYYFEIQADGNLETLVTSPRFTTRAACDEAIAQIRQQAADGTIIDTTEGPPP
jgi:uncharacterized protein YegP (UPF0339 family)